jgi:hypothetical protein
MLKTKLSIVIALLAALSLVVTPAAYAAEGTAQGSFGAASQAPTVQSIQIYTTAACNVVAPSMTPGVTYWAKVTISSPNKLKHLQTVRATIYYDFDSSYPVAPGTGDPQECAILSRTVGDGALNWSIDAGGSTTWAIVPASCSEPADLNVTLGDWKFAFTPGKVAHEAIPTTDCWDAQGYTINKNSQDDDAYVYDKAMDWYGEITMNTTAVDWGTVPLGLTFQTDAGNGNPQTGISVTYLANGDYYEDVNSSENWTGETSLEIVALDGFGGNPPFADSQFALQGNRTSDNTTWVTVQTSYNHIYSNGTITSETPAPVANNTLWLSLSAAGITPDKYDGEIHYQIANR